MEQEQNLLIVSDLHLGEGLDQTSGKTSRLEDFLFGDAFARFLRYHENVKEQPRFGGRPWLLIFNGDLFEFLQIISKPEEGRLLRTVKGIDLCDDLLPNERKYGLGTTAEESVWKLRRIAHGHQRFFAALGWFVAHGNHVAIVKGNHDVELYWDKVQACFIKEVKRAYTRERLVFDGGPLVTVEECGARVHFYPWFYYEPGRVYVEHGCQYEGANHFRDFLNPVLSDDPARIQLPWGSLFVRYLFNDLERVHPFADNIRPVTRYLGWAFKKNAIEALTVFVSRGPVFLRACWNVIRKTMDTMFQTPRERGPIEQSDCFPLPPQVMEEIDALARQQVDASWQGWIASLGQGFLALLMFLIMATFVALAGVTLITDGRWWMALVYLAAGVLSILMRRELKRGFAGLLERDHMREMAKELECILKSPHSVHYILLGHNHQAALERLERAWYVNTGAWVPVYEKEGLIEGREKLTFFRLAWGYRGTPELLHWDDAAGEPARVVLLGDDES